MHHVKKKSIFVLHVRTKLLNNNEIFGAMDNASIFDSSIVKLIQWDIKLAVYRNNYIHIAMWQCILGAVKLFLIFCTIVMLAQWVMHAY